MNSFFTEVKDTFAQTIRDPITQIALTVLLFLSAVYVIVAINPAFSATAPAINPKLEAASGQGTYDHTARLTARLQLCAQAITQQVPPEALTSALKANGFDDTAVESTMDVCVAFATGMSIASGQGVDVDTEGRAPDHNNEPV